MTRSGSVPFRQGTQVHETPRARTTPRRPPWKSKEPGHPGDAVERVDNAAPRNAVDTMDPKSRNIVFHRGTVTREDREQRLGQRGCVLWFTGLSGSGKSTIAHAVELRLFQLGHLCQVLDGDNIRHGLCRDLGFDAADRTENIRRIAEVAKLATEAGLIVSTAFISPFREDREQARTVVGSDRFLEVFLDVPIDECERRDPKGLYAKVRRGEIPEFTGISSPYEAPLAPELTIPTAGMTIEQSVDAVVAYLAAKGFLRGPGDENEQ
jgi:adenylylsulfate kinase